MMKNMMKKVNAILVAGALMLSAAGAYSAFMATTDTKVNTFNIVEGGGEAGKIVEPGWDEENAKDMQPGKVVVKDPKVVSTASYEAWVFLTVEIPTFQATLNDKAGVYDTVTPNFNADGKWTLIKSEKSSAAGTNSKYTYGYNEKVSAGGETTALFTQFSVPDFSRTEAITDSIDISGRMMQTEGCATLDDAATALGLK